MGLGENNYYILTRYLGQGRIPTMREYEKSKAHGVPEMFHAGGSMNWWVLGTGVRYAFGDQREESQIIAKLKQERDEIGMWGSEQHSPIYWAFHLVGRLVLYKNTNSQELKDLIANQMTALFAYCRLAMSPAGTEVLWAGMRGCGHEEFASYELWWLYKSYIEQLSQPPKRPHWKKQKDVYGWLTNAYVSLTLSRIRPLVDVMLDRGELPKVRSRTHFMRWGSKDKLVYTEDDQHPSTAFKGASGYLNGERVNAPSNYYIRKRGAGAEGEMFVHYDQLTHHLRVEYSGPYNKLAKAKPVVFDEPLLDSLSMHVVWGPNGYEDRLNLTSGGGLFPKPVREKVVVKKKGVWEWLKELFS